MLRTVVNSASLRAAWALALGGAAFTLGNLGLARALPAAEYGLLSLVIGVLSVASLAAPLGIDLVVARRGMQLGALLRRRALAASLLTGLVAAAVCSAAYGLNGVLVAAIAIGTAAAGVVQAGVAHFQGARRFGIAAWLLQITNLALLPVALIALLWGMRTAAIPSVLLALATAVGAVGAWILVISQKGPEQSPPRLGAMWREALSLLAITMASSVFMQLERLVLIPTVGVHGLALFGVVAALVGSPFRMIQSAVLFTLIPNMRAAQSTSERRRLLGREIAVVSGALVVGATAIWLAAPPVAHWFLGGRYDLTDALMAAAIVSGLLKVGSAFATAVAVALGDATELRRVSLTAWLSVGISVAGAFLARDWGLTGVLYGISAGWLVRTCAATWIAAPHLLQRRGGLPHPAR